MGSFRRFATIGTGDQQGKIESLAKGIKSLARKIKNELLVGLLSIQDKIAGSKIFHLRCELDQSFDPFHHHKQRKIEMMDA